jgi:hypothetical protein
MEAIPNEHNGDTLYHMVVMNLLDGLSNTSHVVIINNYFIWIGFYKEVFVKGFGATIAIVWDYLRH